MVCCYVDELLKLISLVRGEAKKMKMVFIVVGQSLWFRVHVRCSFYDSIHKDNGGRSGTRSQVKKLKDLERKYYGAGPVSFK